MKSPKTLWRFYRQFATTYCILVAAIFTLLVIILTLTGDLEKGVVIFAVSNTLTWTLFLVLDEEIKKHRFIRMMFAETNKNMNLAWDKAKLEGELSSTAAVRDSTIRELKMALGDNAVLKDDIACLKLEINKLKANIEQKDIDHAHALADEQNTHKAQTEELQKQLIIKEARIASLNKTIKKNNEALKESKEALKDAENNHDSKCAKLQEELLTLSSHSFIIPESAQRYFRHYKGGVYKMLALGTNTDKNENTHSNTVVYMSLINGEVYTRSVPKFFSSISARTAKELGIKFKKGNTLPPRFEEITQEEAEEIAANWPHFTMPAEEAEERTTSEEPSNE